MSYKTHVLFFISFQINRPARILESVGGDFCTVSCSKTKLKNIMCICLFVGLWSLIFLCSTVKESVMLAHHQ